MYTHIARAPEMLVYQHPHRRAIRALEMHPEGVTIMPDGSIPDFRDGYIVAVTDKEVQHVTPMTIDNIVQIIHKHPLATMIGGWHSKHTGRFCIDAVAHIKQLDLALRIARMHHQEAIYDIAKEYCIYVK
jgi:hypothetical protein